MVSNIIGYNVIFLTWFFLKITFAKTKILDPTAVTIYFWRYLKDYAIPGL